MGRPLDFVAALICIAAGVYLLQYNAVDTNALGAAAGTSWFQIIGHGMGIYFIGKGLYVGRSSYLQAETHERLKQLVELQARDHQG